MWRDLIHESKMEILVKNFLCKDGRFLAPVRVNGRVN
jgi:hypothetical protein